MKNIDKYLETLYIQEDLIILNEMDLLKLFKNITIEKAKLLTKQIKSKLDEKNPTKSLKNIKALVSNLPKIKVKALDTYAKEKMKNYESMKKTSKLILANSLPHVSKPMQDVAATFLVVSSMFGKKGASLTHKQNLTIQIKTFVTKVRTFGEGYEVEEPPKRERLLQKEDIPDLAVAWTIVAMTTALAVGVGGGVFVILSSIPTLISAHFYGIIIFLFFIVLVVASVIMVGKG